MITNEIRERLIDYFWDELGSWDYDSWSSASAGDKEDIVGGALVDLDLPLTIDIDEIYELFWNWADGIDEDCFEEEEYEED